MTLDELIKQLETAQELATEGEPWEVRGTGILKMQSREFIECHSPSDAQAITIRHNTASEVLTWLCQLEKAPPDLSTLTDGMTSSHAADFNLDNTARLIELGCDVTFKKDPTP